MLNDMLAKMASKMGGASEDVEMEAEMESPAEGQDDGDKRYKAGAVIAALRPKLVDALKKKDPEKFDAFMTQFGSMMKESSDLMRAGKKDEANQKAAQAKEFADKSDLETYLSADEMKSILGKDYEPFIKATIDIMGTAQPVQTMSKGIVGSKEKGTASKVGDVLFGRRFATMMVNTGIEGTKNGQKGFARFYKYNPKTQQAEIDTEASYGMQ